MSGFAIPESVRSAIERGEYVDPEPEPRLPEARGHAPFDGRVVCIFCGEKVAPRLAWRRVRGWEKKRSAGGTNAVRLREPLDEWACDTCITIRRGGAQEPLL